MPSATLSSMHQFHRHPDLPWAELRVSRQSCHSYRLHAHAQYSIGIVDEGQTLFHHDQGPDQVQTRGVVLIEPGHWHACNPEISQPWSYRMLFVQAEWVHAQLGVQALHFAQRSLHAPEIAETVDALCQPQPLRMGEDHLDALLHTYGQSLLQLLRQVGTPVHTPSPSATEHPAIFPALQHLHRSPEDETTVQALAQTCGMSPTRFIRQFRSLTGVTPGVYKTNLRLNGARHLLAQGEALADVAQHMGFADQAHLQRSFKAHHALTPGNYARAQP